MKKSVIIFFLMAVFASCSEDTMDDLLPEMSATIDGEEWETITRVTIQKEDNFIITGTSSSGETLVITTYGSTEGTYTLSTTSSSIECAALYKETASTSTEDAAVAISGSVTISEVNTSSNKITGTFEFSILNNGSIMSVTDGVFDGIKYTIQ